MKSKTLLGDKVLQIVKIVIVLEFIILVISIFPNTGIENFILYTNVGTINFISFLLLLIYFFWHYYDGKKRMTCTGCKVANTGANVVIYSIVLVLLTIIIKL
jgi:hypothetical protein